jgi:hypothetical protein
MKSLDLWGGAVIFEVADFLKKSFMTHIEKIRFDIKNDFDETIFKKGDNKTYISSSGKFRLDTTNYWCKAPNWNLTKVEIFEQLTSEKFFDFFSNDDFFFFSWLKKDDKEYIVCAEDLFGGQTVIDLMDKKMASYSTGDDGFIWTDFHLSPDGKKLATIGCFWACPYVIKIFDFTSPLILPLKELKEIELLDNDEIIIGWVDNENVKTKGVKRVKQPEYLDDGSLRLNIINETPVERLLNVSVS